MSAPADWRQLVQSVRAELRKVRDSIARANTDAHTFVREVRRDIVEAASGVLAAERILDEALEQHPDTGRYVEGHFEYEMRLLVRCVRSSSEFERLDGADRNAVWNALYWIEDNRREASREYVVTTTGLKTGATVGEAEVVLKPPPQGGGRPWQRCDSHISCYAAADPTLLHTVWTRLGADE